MSPKAPARNADVLVAAPQVGLLVQSLLHHGYEVIGPTIRDSAILYVATPRACRSMERNMKCALGLWGHCQFGPTFVCKDGPVFRLDRVSSILGRGKI